MKRYIRNAEQEQITAEVRLDDAMRILKDDFDFVMDGISKIAVDGDIYKSLELVNGLSEMINAYIEEMAESIAED